MHPDPPFVHDVRPVDDLQGLLHVMVGDDDPDVPGLQLGDDLLDVVQRDGIDPREGLVEEHELGGR